MNKLEIKIYSHSWSSITYLEPNLVKYVNSLKIQCAKKQKHESKTLCDMMLTQNNSK